MTQRTTFYWDYSGARNGAGRVGLIQYGNGFYELFNYKPSGLVEEKGLYAPGAAAWLSAWYSYNSEGQRTSLKYPDVFDSQGQIVSTGRTINSTYDSMGRLVNLRDPGLYGGRDMVSGAQYNAAGQLTQMQVDFEGTRTFTYNTSGQLTGQTSPGVDLEYTFPSTDNDGRLWKKKDWLSGEEVTYQYDEIGRLTAAATTGPEWGLSWTYDGFGNRLAQTVTKGSAPASSVSVNAATNRVVGLGYDNNGNQTSWTTPLGPVTASYDVDNRLASISTPNGSEVYAYSAANQRLRKQGKLYFYGVGGELLATYQYCYCGSGAIPQTPQTLVYFGGMLVFGEGDRRMTMDRLGSTVRTEGNGQPELRFRYYPYGEQQGGAAQDEQVKFGTYWRGSVSGLDYAQNRYFAASQGRFTSADPYQAGASLDTPQSWNAYGYAWGSPTSFLDRLGLQAERPQDYHSGYCPASLSFAECLSMGFLSSRSEAEVGGGGWMSCSIGMGLLPNPLCGQPVPIIVVQPAPPPQPTCTVELWYRPVAKTGQNHAYLRVSLTFEGMTSTDQIEGGPERNGVSNGNLVRRDYEKGASNHKRTDNHMWGTALTSQNDADLCAKIGRLYLAVTFAENHPVAYSPTLGPNSNSYVNYLLKSSGISYWPTAPPDATVPALSDHTKKTQKQRPIPIKPSNGKKTFLGKQVRRRPTSLQTTSVTTGAYPD